MLKPESLSRIKVIGLEDDLDVIVERLHDFGGLEIRQCTDSRLSQRTSPEFLSTIMEKIILLRGIESHLISQAVPKPKSISLKKALARCDELDLGEKLEVLSDKREALERRTRERRELKKTLEYLVTFKIDPKLIESNTLSFFIGTISKQRLPELENTLLHITSSIHVMRQQVNKMEDIVVFAADSRFGGEIENELRRAGLIRITLPTVSGKPKEMLAGIDEELTELKTKKAGLQDERLKLSKKYWGEVLKLKEVLEIEEERLKSAQMFGVTEKTFALEAWIKKTDYTKIEKILHDAVGDMVILSTIKSNDEPPTVYNNPAFLSPFQDMVEFIALPKSNELDPTVLFAFVFPLFYGMMLGDVGYGILSLMLSILIIKKTSGLLKSLGIVWAYSSVPTIIFGVIYDEYLGFTLAEILGRTIYHAPLERIHNLQTLLVVTILLGIIHVTLGFLLGFKNAWDKGDRTHALGKLSWIGVEACVIVGAMVYFLKILDPIYAYILPLGFVALYFIYRAEGAIGVVELPTLVSNILSYTRILAIGVSSLAIAMVINKLLLPDSSNLFMFLLLTPLYLAAHLFNLVLGMFESLIQSARLNYVEFFSKFYTGGGRRFQPFKAVRKYTIAEGI
ncbi:MAG: V-type ATP synthase subunit I [Methanobacteriota archaeon]